jgi:biotin-dependent carboxylase-like uncharacterized protein
MTLRILDPGLYTLVVDLGRPHCRSLGVPVGGAADRTALMLGNALVGNPPGAAGLEFSLAGPTLEAQEELACVVTGAPFELHCEPQRLEVGHTFTLHRGDVLRIGGTHHGMRGYLCVRGGLQTKVVLGSRSALAPLRAGDELPCLPGAVPARFVRGPFEWQRKRTSWESYPPKQLLRVLEGAQSDWFDLETVFAEQDWRLPPLYQVTQASNRMGLRLHGTPLKVPERELVSEPVCPGTVQVTRDGQCIVLGVDGQTIGGYPKIAQVISADLDVLGQLRPGEEVYFVRVTIDEAQRLYRAQQAELHDWGMRLRVTLADMM